MSEEKETRLKERFSKAAHLLLHATQPKPHYWKLISGPPSGVPRSAKWTTKRRPKTPLDFKINTISPIEYGRRIGF